MATICCWPPDSVPAGASSLASTAGNSAHFRERLCAPPAGDAAVAAELEVLAHGQCREKAPALRHEGDAVIAKAMSGHAGEGCAVDAQVAARVAVHPADGIDERRLAGAIRADDDHQRAGADCQVDPVDGRRGAIGDTQVARLKHAQSPDTRTTSGSRITSRGNPSRWHLP